MRTQLAVILSAVAIAALLVSPVSARHYRPYYYGYGYSPYGYAGRYGPYTPSLPVRPYGPSLDFQNASRY
jgi:hypothetical protein